MNLSQAKNEIEKADTLEDLREINKKYLGKKGEIAKAFVLLKGLPLKKRKEAGREANEAKKMIEELIALKRKGLAKKETRGINVLKAIDKSRPGANKELGSIHLITQTQRQCCQIFNGMGFEVVEGPEVEKEWYNFDALNIPKDHPARDMQDTFWLKDKAGFLPRTHTSPVQVRYMEKHQPPIKIVVPGRVFRNEASDASHEAQFYQLEGLMVDKDISVANFKAVIEEFLTRYFETDVQIRLRPSYFPFVEPGFEIDAKRKGGKWLEMMGAGMVHPNVLKASGLKGKWQGFAFGVGIGRLAMIKHNIPDLRLFYQSDLRFLKQF